MGSLTAGDGKREKRGEPGRFRIPSVAVLREVPAVAVLPACPPLYAQMDSVEVAAAPDAGPGPAWQSKVRGARAQRPAGRCQALAAALGLCRAPPGTWTLRGRGGAAGAGLAPRGWGRTGLPRLGRRLWPSSAGARGQARR